MVSLRNNVESPPPNEAEVIVKNGSFVAGNSGLGRTIKIDATTVVSQVCITRPDAAKHGVLNRCDAAPDVQASAVTMHRVTDHG